ncbi:MAG: hypothetical protein AABZ30_09600, partial [Myxococcota bacterium]
MRRYVVTAAGRDYEVEIESAGDGRALVRVDGRGRLLDARALAGGGVARAVSLIGDGQVHTVDLCDGPRGEVSLHAGSIVLLARVADADRRQIARARLGAGA